VPAFVKVTPTISRLPRKRQIIQDINCWYKNFITSKSLVNDFIAKDPVQFPRRFSERADIEIAAFLAATIAWGRRDLIIRSTEKMLTLMGQAPAGFVMNGGYKKLKNKNIHRTFFESDLRYLCKGFKRCYEKYGSLEKLFASGAQPLNGSSFNIWQGITLFREEMAAANGRLYNKHVADPEKSACKKINLALRWLVRKGPVDVGLWKTVKPADLYIPLDVHVARTARRLGLLNRKSNDRKTVVELTEKLREFCREDPVKYDFALFGMGNSGEK